VGVGDGLGDCAWAGDQVLTIITTMETTASAPQTVRLPPLSSERRGVHHIKSRFRKTKCEPIERQKVRSIDADLSSAQRQGQLVRRRMAGVVPSMPQQHRPGRPAAGFLGRVTILLTPRNRVAIRQQSVLAVQLCVSPA
jgi:hypothetical protein